jgi:Cu2+-exporting ATPase
MELVAGDILQLTAGTAVPADGRIVQGSGSVDEAAFSGEHEPRSVAETDFINAGTLLLDGSPHLQVTAAAANTRIAQLLQLMQQSQQSKPGAVLLADRVAAWFVGGVLLLAAAVAVYWYWQSPEQALWITLSVLVVSCPCALSLATPTALTRAATSLRSSGLLLRDTNCLQQLNTASVVVFDKTGTLTRGELILESTVAFGDMSEADCTELARTLEQHSNHPVARAFGPASGQFELQDVDNHPGLGLSGKLHGQAMRIGSAAFARELNPQLMPCPNQSGYWIVLCSASATLAWFRLQDSLRAEAGSLVQWLQQRGLKVELLSGDHSDQGREIAQQLSMDDQHCGYSPADKLSYIAALQERGERVVMVGDGLNDAPVLARANASIAVSGATDLAKARADAILVNPDLRRIADAFTMAHRCREIIRQNMAWALGYNLLMIPLAATGLVPPWAAAIGMSLSSLLVVGNSLRLRARSQPVAARE